ncbi:MAG: glycosyltransferase family 4 protein [Phycisphaerae bacterium]|jgi:UDP-glucose:(heptosyl)LPS alpha-1,3-glucosyltransferase
MRIALVIERMDVRRGGRETSTAQIAAELARRRHDVTVLCQTGGWSGEGVKVRPLGASGLGRASRLRRFVAAVQNDISASRYDVVHAMLPLPGANVYQPRGGTIPAQWAASLRRRPMFVRPLVHLARPFRPCRGLLGRLERQVASDPNVLCLAVSRMVAQEFARYYGRTDGVQVIYNAADVPDPAAAQARQWRQDLRAHLRVAEGDAVFLTVATNFALKGVAEAIEAFARWYHDERRKTGGRLVIVGRELVEGYHRHASLRDVGPEVVFVPPTENVFQWYAAADVCLLLSWYDPCSRVVLEATRCGVPSITTAFNGAAEVLAGGAGLVVPSPRSQAEIAAAMEDLAEPARRAAFLAACRQAADGLSMTRHVDELLQAYAKITNRP